MEPMNSCQLSTVVGIGYAKSFRDIVAWLSSSWAFGLCLLAVYLVIASLFHS